MNSWKQFIANVVIVLSSLTISFLIVRLTSDYLASIVVDLYYRTYAGLGALIVLSVTIGYVLSRSVALIRHSWRKVVVWCGILASFPALLFFSHVPPLNRGAQKQTMADIRVISNSLETLRSKNGTYPVALTIQSIETQSGVLLPKKDGWGIPFQFRSTVGGYVVVSYGSDGKPDRIEPSGATTQFANDIIFENSKFKSYPEGIQK